MATITTGLTIKSSYGSWYLGPLPIKGDQTSVDQFCIDKGYISGGTFTQDDARFSNDGGRWMNYYGDVSGTTYWINYFGYDPIVTSIIEP